MGSVTFAIDKESQSQLARYPWINWSELSREEILSDFAQAETLSEISVWLQGSKMTEALAKRLGRLARERISQKYKGA